MHSNFIFSPISTHRKTISIQPVTVPKSHHRRIKSTSHPVSPEDLLGLNFPSQCPKPKSANRSFVRLLDAALIYFTQNKTTNSHLNDGHSDFKHSILKLEKEKEDLKITNSKLQLDLANARAKVKVYKKKIQSLKNYCKIIEINALKEISKTMLVENESKVKCEGNIRGKNRRLTAEPITNKSSDTEFNVEENHYK